MHRGRCRAGRGRGPGRALVLIDQFEDCFLLLEEQEQRAFLDRICEAVTDPSLQVTVVVSLRADHYDRALRHRAFGQLFEQGLVNVLPMSPEEIERAVVSPARRSGATVEPALLAELVADTVERPGLLPAPVRTDRAVRPEQGRTAARSRLPGCGWPPGSPHPPGRAAAPRVGRGAAGRGHPAAAPTGPHRRSRPGDQGPDAGR